MPDQVVRTLIQLHQPQGPVDLLLPFRLRDAVQVGVYPQVLPARQPVVHAGVLENDADRLPHVRRVPGKRRSC